MSKQVLNSLASAYVDALPTLQYHKRMQEVYLACRVSSFNSTQISTSRDAYELLRQFYEDDITLFESFFLVLLNRSNKTIGFAKISQGGVHGTVVDPKIIGKYALDSLACGVIIAHNHPSGNLKPSRQDIEITKKLNEAMSLFDIKLLDHLILTNESYYSFTDEGLI